MGQVGTVRDLMRDEYPGTTLIVLEPVAGGPGHAECSTNGTGASRNHPVIDEAIAQLVGGDVATRLSPAVRAVSDTPISWATRRAKETRRLALP